MVSSGPFFHSASQFFSKDSQYLLPTPVLLAFQPVISCFSLCYASNSSTTVVPPELRLFSVLREKLSSPRCSHHPELQKRCDRLFIPGKRKTTLSSPGTTFSELKKMLYHSRSLLWAGAVDPCYNQTAGTLFPVCDLSLNSTSKEYKPTVRVQLPPIFSIGTTVACCSVAFYSAGSESVGN